MGPARPATVGAFCVMKKDGRHSLVLDTREANCLFVRPWHSALPSPAALAAVRGEPGEQVFMAQTDVDNAFYRVSLPDGMVECFALPAASVRLLRKCGAKVASEWDDDSVVSPLLTVLPMGFSWALFFCQR